MKQPVDAKMEAKRLALREHMRLLEQTRWEVKKAMWMDLYVRPIGFAILTSLLIYGCLCLVMLACGCPWPGVVNLP